MAGSFTENFNKLMRCFACNEQVSLTDRVGTTRVIEKTDQGNYSIGRYRPNSLLALGSSMGIEGNLDVGITCGTLDTAFNANDYNVKTLIPHGDSNGQLHYMQSVVGGMSVSGAGVTTKQISRIVTNNGATSIVVKEIALILAQRANDEIQYGFCVYREVLSSPVTIASTQSATFQITLTIPNLVTL